MSNKIFDSRSNKIYVLPKRLKIQQHENNTIALFVSFIRGDIITTTILDYKHD